MKAKPVEFVAQPLAHKPVNLASLTDSFIVSVYRAKSAEQIARKRPRLVHYILHVSFIIITLILLFIRDL